MMKALMVEFTKSRACRSQDNALVEGKNGAIIRKLIGYGHIPAEHAEQLQKFYTAYLNPYLNFHRPCGFATVSVDARRKRHTEYRPEDYATPWQKLKGLPGAEAYLKAEISMASLDRIEAGATRRLRRRWARPRRKSCGPAKSNRPIRRECSRGNDRNHRAPWKWRWRGNR
jgi:hypothetical protein